MRLRIFLTMLFMVSFHFCFSQNKIEYKTWNPANDTLLVLEGQAWPHEVKNFYDRLPARAEQSVREAVWNLSKNSAGLQMRFQTNASEIIIKYQVTGSLQMPHMPATGVSGVDLYSKTMMVPANQQAIPMAIGIMKFLDRNPIRNCIAQIARTDIYMCILSVNTFTGSNL